MLYVFSGERDFARKGSNKVIEVCKNKRKNAELIKVTPFDEIIAEELLLGCGLFEKQYIVFCEELENSQFFTYIKDNKKNFINSSHVFVIFEPDMDKKTMDSFKKAGAVVHYKQKVLEKKGTTEGFILAEAFIQKQREKALILMTQLIKKGSLADQLINILMWQIRVLILVQKSKNEKESGVKAFPYKKALTALKKYKNDEPFSLFLSCEKIIQEQRLKSIPDVDILERIILNNK